MHKQFVTYIMGGQTMLDELRALDQAGVDYVEIGIPYSDPVADGPVIMEAGQSAIQSGRRTQDVFDDLKSVQGQLSTKVVLMTYAHSIETYGEEAFFKAAEDAGVYGLIIPDMPHEYIEQLKEKYPNRKLKFISLIAMTADPKRREHIAKHAEGFIYTVTMNEVTGKNGTFHPELLEHIEEIKRIASVPVLAGFGIRTADHVQNISQASDGVIIGSEIVRRFKEDGIPSTIEFIQTLQHALENNSVKQ
ncbi:tryptophan synthase subunit alpha [Staphylococcus canis]|nr:tryptophan synthase subunit alpha [Staphylococcus canis]